MYTLPNSESVDTLYKDFMEIPVPRSLNDIEKFTGKCLNILSSKKLTLDESNKIEEIFKISAETIRNGIDQITDTQRLIGTHLKKRLIGTHLEEPTLSEQLDIKMCSSNLGVNNTSWSRTYGDVRVVYTEFLDTNFIPAQITVRHKNVFLPKDCCNDTDNPFERKEFKTFNGDGSVSIVTIHGPRSLVANVSPDQY